MNDEGQQAAEEPEDKPVEGESGTTSPSSDAEKAPAGDSPAAESVSDEPAVEGSVGDSDSVSVGEIESAAKELDSETANGADIANDAVVDGVDANAESDVASASNDEVQSEHEQVDVAAEEAAIRSELGIGGGRIEIDEADVEKLLEEAVVGYEEIFAGTVLDDSSAMGSSTLSSELEDIGRGGDMVAQNLSLLRDVNMKVKVELGRGRMYLKDILRLAQGSVVELERLAGDPLDIYVNEKVVARGEVLVLNENFCIRITEIHNPAEVLAHGA